MYLTMKDLIFYGNVTMELRVDMLAARRLPGRYYKLDYGGLQCLKMLRTMLGPAMHVKEWGSHIIVMSNLYTLFEHCKPLKNVVDFIGPINPPTKHSKARCIITATDYLVRWAEEDSVRDCSTATATRFIFQNIITRFGCPPSLTNE